MKKFLLRLKEYFIKKNIKGSMDDSITYFNKSMQDKDKAELVRIQGHARMQKGDISGALKKYDQALEIYPDSSEIEVDRAIVFEKQGDIKKAFNHLAVALKKDNTNITAYEVRAKFHELNKDNQAALNDREKIAQLKTTKLEDNTRKLATKEEYFRRGTEKMDQENLEGALEDFDKAILLNNEYKEAYLSRAAIKRVLGDLEGVSSDTRKANQIQQ